MCFISMVTLRRRSHCAADINHPERGYLRANKTLLNSSTASLFHFLTPTFLSIHFRLPPTRREGLGSLQNKGLKVNRRKNTHALITCRAKYKHTDDNSTILANNPKFLMLTKQFKWVSNWWGDKGLLKTN